MQSFHQVPHPMCPHTGISGWDLHENHCWMMLDANWDGNRHLGGGLGMPKQEWRTETGCVCEHITAVSKCKSLGLWIPWTLWNVLLESSSFCAWKPGHSSSLLSIISIACDFMNAATINSCCLGWHRWSLTYDGSCVWFVPDRKTFDLFCVNDTWVDVKQRSIIPRELQVIKGSNQDTECCIDKFGYSLLWVYLMYFDLQYFLFKMTLLRDIISLNRWKKICLEFFRLFLSPPPPTPVLGTELVC